MDTTKKLKDTKKLLKIKAHWEEIIIFYKKKKISTWFFKSMRNAINRYNSTFILLCQCCSTWLKVEEVWFKSCYLSLLSINYRGLLRGGVNVFWKYSSSVSFSVASAEYFIGFLSAPSNDCIVYLFISFHKSHSIWTASSVYMT